MEFWKILNNKRCLKGTLYTLCGLILILILIQSFFDINQYKNQVEKYVEHKIDHSFQIQGLMKLRFFPQLTIQLQDVTLKKKANNKNNLLHVETINIYPSLLSLIFGQKTVKVEMLDLKFKNYVFSKFKTKIKLKSSQIEFLSTGCHFAHEKEDRHLKIDYIKLDFNDKSPVYSLKHQSGDFSLAFISALTPKAKMTGDTKIHIDMMAKGSSIDEIKKTLTGEFTLEISKGKLHGLDLLESLREAKSIFETVTNKLSHTLTDTFDALTHRKHFVPVAITHFDNFKLSGKIDNGIIKTEESNIQHEHFVVKGSGNINIAKNVLDYKVIAYYKEKGIIMSPQSLLKLAPLVIHLGGSFDKISIRPELNSYLNYVQQDTPNVDALKSAPKKLLKSVKKVVRSIAH